MFNLNSERLTFQTIQTKYFSDLIKNGDINKTAGIDDLSQRFLIDDADILTISITQITIYPSNSLIFLKTVK